jgi:hypothetical protein
MYMNQCLENALDRPGNFIPSAQDHDRLTRGPPPKPLPLENRSPPGSGLGITPGLEADNVDTGQFWSTDEGPTFVEFLYIINPLQHIPVVSTLYRAITGDQIGTGPRVAGGMLFGRPVGALVAGITALFEEASGGDGGATTENVAAGIADTPKDTLASAQAGAQAGLDAGLKPGQPFNRRPLLPVHHSQAPQSLGSLHS